MRSLRRPVRRHGGGRTCVGGSGRSAVLGAHSRAVLGVWRSAVVGARRSAVVGARRSAVAGGGRSAVVGGSEGTAQALMELEWRRRPLYARRPERAPPQPLMWIELMHP